MDHKFSFWKMVGSFFAGGFIFFIVSIIMCSVIYLSSSFSVMEFKKPLWEFFRLVCAWFMLFGGIAGVCCYISDYKNFPNLEVED